MDLGFDSAGALRLRNKLARPGGCGWDVELIDYLWWTCHVLVEPSAIWAAFLVPDFEHRDGDWATKWLKQKGAYPKNRG